MIKIGDRRYTSGRIAVANLSSSIDSLEPRGIEGATFEDLEALSNLLFLRGDLLGRIADHDRAERVAELAVALSPEYRARASSSRAARGKVPPLRGSTGALDRALAAGCPGDRSTRQGPRCSRRPENIVRRCRCVRAWRRPIVEFTRSARSPRCWRKCSNGRRPTTGTRQRSLRMMGSLPYLAPSCSSNGAWARCAAAIWSVRRKSSSSSTRSCRRTFRARASR